MPPTASAGGGPGDGGVAVSLSPKAREAGVLVSEDRGSLSQLKQGESTFPLTFAPLGPQRIG